MSPGGSARARHWAAAASALLAIAIHWPTREGDFAWDDRAAVLQNPDVDPALTSWSSLWGHDFWGQDLTSPGSHKSYRPLASATLRANVIAAAGAQGAGAISPYWFHISNIILHGANCGLASLL